MKTSTKILEARYWKAYSKVNNLMRRFDVFERPQKKSYLRAKAEEDRLRSLYYNALAKETNGEKR